MPQRGQEIIFFSYIHFSMQDLHISLQQTELQQTTALEETTSSKQTWQEMVDIFFREIKIEKKYYKVVGL